MVDEAERGRHRTRDAVLAGASTAPGAAHPDRGVLAAGGGERGGPRRCPEHRAAGRGDLERRRTTSGLAPRMPALTAGAQLRRRRRPADRGHRHRGPGALAGRQRRGTADGRPARLRRRLRVDRGQRRHQRDRHRLVLGEPVQIRGAEHYVESHTIWGCAAAPARRPVDRADPRCRRRQRAVPGLHPAELGLVALAARLSALELVERHRATLDRLRSLAAPMVARLTGQAARRRPRRAHRPGHRHPGAATGSCCPAPWRSARSGCPRSAPRPPRPCPAAGCSASGAGSAGTGDGGRPDRHARRCG